MATEDRKTLEEKIDFLIEESEKTKQERKKEKVLSRVDGFFYSLIALSTFTSGLIISQHDFLTAKESAGLLFLMVAVVFSMLFSFIIGFKGMLYDSMKNRILAWCFLLVCLIFYPTALFVYVAKIIVQNETAVLLIGLILGTATVLVQGLVSKKFTNWLEARLASLLGQKIDVWGEIKGKILSRFLLIYVLSLVVSIAISALIQRP
ncbi:MAG TPA: hypothetical protein VJ249_08825 [Candidatus Bathyarchaeia archaeon]|nr:hypothetical protein [Candidatus Bathyarchaeia archaeon]